MTFLVPFAAADHSRAAPRALASCLPQRRSGWAAVFGRGAVSTACDQLLDGGDDLEEAAVRRGGEALGDDVIDKAEQGAPVAGDIDQDDRLVMQAELAPGQDLEGLVQRAEPAGHDGEGVGLLEHHVFALMHAVDHDQLGGAAMADLVLSRWPGMMPTTSPPRGQGGVGEGAHQADAGAAIDQADMPRGQQPAEVARGLEHGGCRRREPLPQ